MLQIKHLIHIIKSEGAEKLAKALIIGLIQLRI